MNFKTCCAVIAGLMATVSVSAHSDVSVASDLISMNFETTAGKVCSVAVVEDDYTKANINLEIPKQLQYQGEVVADSNGVCLISFRMLENADSGDYIIRVLPDGGTVEEFSFYYFSEKEKQGIIDSFDNKSKTEIISLLNTNSEVLGLTFGDGAETDKDKAFARIADNVASGVKFTPDTLYNCYVENFILEAVSQNDTAFMVKDGVLQHNNITKLNESSVYSQYTDNLSSTGKEKVLNSIMGGSFATISDLKDAFEKNTVFNALYNYKEGGYGHVQAVISATEDVLKNKLNVSVSTYNALSNKDDFARMLMAQSPAGIEGLAEAFTKACNDAIYTIINPGIISGGNSGGGGGGGSSSKLSEYTMYPENSGTVTSSKMFYDTDDVPWAVESIEQLASKGIINGKSAGVYAPNDNVTREEFIKMLVIAFNLKATGNNTFSDVQSGAWYEQYVSAGVASGIVKGYEDNTFGVGKPITREEMSVMAYRAALAYGKVFSKADYESFGDDYEISSYAKEAVYNMKNTDIINGMGNNTFAPLELCSRAQAAKVIASLLKL